MKLEDIRDWSKWKLSPAHTGKLTHALDFMCEEGSPIYAAAAGKVIYVKQDSKVGGSDRKKYWDKGNRIVIRHSNGEYTAYEHLKYRGANVKEGDRVRKGQLIGYTGNTGFSHFPHLHFEVFNEPSEDETEGQTLLITFPELQEL